MQRWSALPNCSVVHTLLDRLARFWETIGCYCNQEGSHFVCPSRDVRSSAGDSSLATANIEGSSTTRLEIDTRRKSTLRRYGRPVDRRLLSRRYPSTDAVPWSTAPTSRALTMSARRLNASERHPLTAVTACRSQRVGVSAVACTLN